MKVLLVVDRLLDRSVLHFGDPNFNEMAVWLQQVERSLDPYRRWVWVTVAVGEVCRVF